MRAELGTGGQTSRPEVRVSCGQLRGWAGVVRGLTEVSYWLPDEAEQEGAVRRAQTWELRNTTDKGSGHAGRSQQPG